MNKIIKYALIDAIGTALYVIIVASFMYIMQGNAQQEIKTILIPVAMLMLFVFSAALTGFLVFGRPVMMYLDGKKKEAVLLLGYTLGFLFIITIFAFLLLLAYLNLAASF